MERASVKRPKRRAKAKSRERPRPRRDRAPEPAAIRAEPLTLGDGPNARDPAGRMAFIEQLMPGVADYVASMVRAGLDPKEWVILLLDPRRKDMRRQVEQVPLGRSLVARVMMELADDRPAACIQPVPLVEFRRWLERTFPDKGSFLDGPLRAGHIYFAAFFQENVLHGTVRLPDPPRSPLVA